MKLLRVRMLCVCKHVQSLTYMSRLCLCHHLLVSLLVFVFLCTGALELFPRLVHFPPSFPGIVRTAVVYGLSSYRKPLTILR